MRRQSSENWAKDLNSHFTSKDIGLTNKHMERYLTLLNISKMQIKMTMRYYFTAIRMTIIKETIASVVKDMGEPDLKLLGKM